MKRETVAAVKQYEKDYLDTPITDRLACAAALIVRAANEKSSGADTYALKAIAHLTGFVEFPE